MKIDELKNGDVIVQCVDTGSRSAYTSPVRRMTFTVVMDSDGIKLDDGNGTIFVPDFSEGRWYFQKKRNWTPDEMRSLVGRTITDDYGTRLIVEYSNSNNMIGVIVNSGFKRFGHSDVGSFFGEKYDLVKIE